MQRRSGRNAIPLSLLVCGLFLFPPALPAQEKCNVEVKLLLPPAETQNAVSALIGKKERVTHIYFFDTDTLELLSQGVIIRLRRGAGGELTVKLRSPSGERPNPPSEKGDDFKCEVDQTGEGAAVSYSIRQRYDSEEIPQTGNEVSLLLSPGQKKLLNDAQVRIDWARVRRIAEVTSMAWQTQVRAQLGKLALEVWEWPGGKILELSTKVPSESGPSAYAELRQLIENKHLSMSLTQQPKTSIVLHSVTHITPP